MNQYQEKITVSLLSHEPQSRIRLHGNLVKIGCICEDYFYYLERTDEVMVWQAGTLANINVFARNQHIHEYDEDIFEGTSSDWDRLDISYLLATNPISNIKDFVSQIEIIKNMFELTVNFYEMTVSIANLQEHLVSTAHNVTERFAPVGSKEIAILIAQAYSRRR